MRSAILFLAAFVITLSGCSADEIRKDRKREFAELGRVYVGAAASPPASGELSARLGSPEVHSVEGLVFHAYALDYEQQKAMHAELRKPVERARKEAERARKEAEREKDKSGIGVGDVAVWVFGAPITAASLVLALPLIIPAVAADVAVGYTIVSVEGDDRPAQAAGRKVLFVYDANGTYRWHACCLPPELTDEKGLKTVSLPGPSEATTATMALLPHTYRFDNTVLRCHRARSGELSTQHELSKKFKDLQDLPLAYYWARVVDDDPETKWSDPRERLEAVMSDDERQAGDAYYEAHPLARIDCRALAERLVKGQESRPRDPASG